MNPNSVIAFVMAMMVVVVAVVADGDRCQIACTREYKPVCAELRRPKRPSVHCTFSNDCGRRVARCLNGDEGWKLVHKGECKDQSAECIKLLG